jgi:hypothetical protein
MANARKHTQKARTHKSAIVILAVIILSLAVWVVTVQHSTLTARDFTLAPGWSASQYTTIETDTITALAFGAVEPVLFVATSGNEIIALRDTNASGVANLRFAFARAPQETDQLYVQSGDLYAVGAQESLRYVEAEGHIAVGSMSESVDSATIAALQQATAREQIVTLIRDEGLLSGPRVELTANGTTHVVAKGWRSGFVLRAQPVAYALNASGTQLFVADSRGNIWLFTRR